MTIPTRLAIGLLSVAAVAATVGCRRSSSDAAIDNAAKTTSAVLETLSPPVPVVVNVPAQVAPVVQPPVVNVTVNVPPAQVVSTGGNAGTNDTNATQSTAPAQTAAAPAYVPPPVVYAPTPAPPATAPAAAGYVNGAANAPTNPAQPAGGYTGIGGGDGYTGVTGGSGYTGVGGGTGFTGVGGGGASLTPDGG